MNTTLQHLDPGDSEAGDYDADAAQLRLRGLHGVERRQLTTEQAWLQTE